LSNLSSETLNSNHGLPPLNPDLTNITANSNMSQFPNLPGLETLNLSQLTGTSSESDETEEKQKKPDRFTRLEEGFLEQFAGIGTNLMLMGADTDGQIILARAQPLAHKLTNVARQNPAVYRALKKYLDGSVYAMLAEEVGVVGLAICANHGIDPFGWVKSLFKKKPGSADGNDQLSAVA